jgi:hypothetical protein
MLSLLSSWQLLNTRLNAALQIARTAQREIDTQFADDGEKKALRHIGVADVS